MKFLVDAQLPPAICGWLEQRGHEAAHVTAVLGGDTEDALIAAYVESNGMVLISKDEDFAVRFAGRPMRLLWVRCGNMRTATLIDWLAARWPATEALLQAGEKVVELR